MFPGMDAQGKLEVAKDSGGTTVAEADLPQSTSRVSPTSEGEKRFASVVQGKRALQDFCIANRRVLPRPKNVDASTWAGVLQLIAVMHEHSEFERPRDPLALKTVCKIGAQRLAKLLCKSPSTVKRYLVVADDAGLLIVPPKSNGLVTVRQLGWEVIAAQIHQACEAKLIEDRKLWVDAIGIPTLAADEIETGPHENGRPVQPVSECYWLDRSAGEASRGGFGGRSAFGAEPPQTPTALVGTSPTSSTGSSSIDAEKLAELRAQTALLTEIRDRLPSKRSRSKATKVVDGRTTKNASLAAVSWIRSLPERRQREILRECLRKSMLDPRRVTEDGVLEIIERKPDGAVAALLRDAHQREAAR